MAQNTIKKKFATMGKEYGYFTSHLAAEGPPNILGYVSTGFESQPPMTVHPIVSLCDMAESEKLVD